MKEYHVYILSNKYNGTLYIGVTSNIIKRIWQYRQKIIKGFTSKYDIDKLVYFEQLNDVSLVITREKRLTRIPKKMENRFNRIY